MLYLRSALFLVWFVAVTLAMNLGALPLFLLPKRFTLAAAALWARLVLFGLKWIVGLGFEVRGVLDDTRVIVAAKHFSMWETIALLTLLPAPAIVLKRSLLNIPLYGWYCRKMQMIGIDRTAGAQAIRAMLEPAMRALSEARPIVIFPEGTRKRLDDAPDYKPGVAALYAQLGVSCVPVALNSGLFWTGRFLRRPGTVVVELLEPIPPGLKRREFLTLLETRTETATARLVAEGRDVPASRLSPLGL